MTAAQDATDCTSPGPGEALLGEDSGSSMLPKVRPLELTPQAQPTALSARGQPALQHHARPCPRQEEGMRLMAVAVVAVRAAATAQSPEHSSKAWAGEVSNAPAAAWMPKDVL